MHPIEIFGVNDAEIYAEVRLGMEEVAMIFIHSEVGIFNTAYVHSPIRTQTPLMISDDFVAPTHLLLCSRTSVSAVAGC